MMPSLRHQTNVNPSGPWWKRVKAVGYDEA
jgi:hypothetical protein